MLVHEFILQNVHGDGWFYSKKWNHFQKRNDRVYCYISPIMSGWKAQLYLTGTTAGCELDVQTTCQTLEAARLLFDVANNWLDQYSSGELEHIHQDKYSISNPKGVWRKNREKKEWLIL